MIIFLLDWKCNKKEFHTGFLYWKLALNCFHVYQCLLNLHIYLRDIFKNENNNFLCQIVYRWVGAETLGSVSFQPSDEAQTGSAEDCTWALGWFYTGEVIITINTLLFFPYQDHYGLDFITPVIHTSTNTASIFRHSIKSCTKHSFIIIYFKVDISVFFLSLSLLTVIIS